MTQMAMQPVVAVPRRSRLPAFLGYWLAYGFMLLIPMGLFVYAMLVWVPEVRGWDMDFKVALPPLSQWALEMSASVGTASFWVEMALTVGLVSALLAVVTALMPRGFLRAAIAMISMLVILALTAGEAIVLHSAIWNPLLEIMGKVQGGA